MAEKKPTHCHSDGCSGVLEYQGTGVTATGDCCAVLVSCTACARDWVTIYRQMPLDLEEDVSGGQGQAGAAKAPKK